MTNRIALAWAAVAGLGLLGAAGPQEPGPLQKSLQDLEPKGPWVYGDMAAGYAEAKKSGKPMLVVFR